MQTSTTTSTSTSNVKQSNAIRLHIGPHIALKNASLSSQRRNLLHRINHLEQMRNPFHHQQQKSESGNASASNENNSNNNSASSFFRYPSSFPYTNTEVPPPTQSLEGSQIGVFKPPTKHLRSVRPVQQTAAQLIQVAQLASQENSPYNLQLITEKHMAPIQSREEIEEKARKLKEREEEIKTLKERLTKLQTPVAPPPPPPFSSAVGGATMSSSSPANASSNGSKAHVFVPTAKPFISSTTTAAATTSISPSAASVASATPSTVAGNVNAKPFISSIPVTNTRQMGFQMNAVANAAPFVPAFARQPPPGPPPASALAARQQQQQQQNEESNPRTTAETEEESNKNSNVNAAPHPPAMPLAVGKMAGLANGGFGSSTSPANSTTSFASATSPTSSLPPTSPNQAQTTSSRLTPALNTNVSNSALAEAEEEEEHKKDKNNNVSTNENDETKKSTPTTSTDDSCTKPESHRSSPPHEEQVEKTNQDQDKNNKNKNNNNNDDDDGSATASFKDDATAFNETSATHSFKSSQFTTTQNSPLKNQVNQQEEEQQQNTTTTEESSAFVIPSVPSSAPRFSKLTVTDFDAVLLKIAPLPRCHDPAAPLAPTEISSPSLDKKKNEQVEKNKDDDDDQQESEGKKKKIEHSYSIPEFMSLRHHLNAMSSDSARNLLNLVYVDWEDHLNRALDGVRKQPGSPLLFAERNIPPLYIGRPEYHEMVLERVEHFKQHPEELTQHLDEQEEIQQQQQAQQRQNTLHQDPKEMEEHEQKIKQHFKHVRSNEYAGASSHLCDYAVTFSSAKKSKKGKNKSNNIKDSVANATSTASAGGGILEAGRAGLFANPTRGRPQKLKSELHNKVLSILSRVTPEKYVALREELLNLPIRQATEEQLSKVVDVFFHKAVQEPKFCGVYADLVMSVFDVAQEEKEAVLQRQNSLIMAASMNSPCTTGGGTVVTNSNGSAGGGQFPSNVALPLSPNNNNNGPNSATTTLSTSTPTPQPSDSLVAFEARSAARTEQLAHRLRAALLQKCHAEFSRDPKLSDKDLIDKETQKPLNREDQEDKWSDLKKRLKGNVRFVGELYNRGAVTDVVVNAALSVLLMQIGALATEKIPPYARGGACQCFNDHLVDVFVTLLDTVGPKFRNKMPDRCQLMVETARKLSINHRTPRTRVLLLNLVDAADGKSDKRWNANTNINNNPFATNSASNTNNNSSISRLGSVQSMMASRMGSVQDFSGMNSAPPSAQKGTNIGAAAFSPFGGMKQQNLSASNHSNSTPWTGGVGTTTIRPSSSSGNVGGVSGGSHLNLSSMQGSPVSPHPGQSALGHVFPNPSSTTATTGSNQQQAAPPPPGYGSTSSANKHSSSRPSTPSQKNNSSTSNLPPPPPPPSYNDHINSNPTSPINVNPTATSTSSLPPRTGSRHSLTGTPPSCQQQQQNNNTSSGNLPPPPSLPPSSTSLSSSSLVNVINNTNIIIASRVASPEKKNSLASLPSTSDLTADECVSLSEALCSIEKYCCDENDSEKMETKYPQNILSFIPITRDLSARQDAFNKKLWSPAEKLSSILHHNKEEDDSSTTTENILAEFFLTTFLKNSSSSSSSSPFFSSGLGFLLAHSISAPSSDGSGKRILDPVLAKNALIKALMKSEIIISTTSVVDEEQKEQLKALCTGGSDVSLQEHQKRASSYFEVIGGGNEESEGFQAAQLLFRSWGNFVNNHLLK